MGHLKWRFNHGDRTGINDSGIETFRGQMITSLGREICQNSIDAVRKDKEKVRIEFKEFCLEKKHIPGIEGLKESFNKGLEFWSQPNNEVDQAINFFEKGIKLMEKDEINILRVSDFNTTGLLKSKESFSSPWINLIMASGVSQKSGNAGGSFGIGKSAPFASTDLRTVFYSTLDTEGVEASQGVCRIATFNNSQGKETSGKGYYGRFNESYPNGNAPIPDQLFLDPEFIRNESGTDIYLIGFREFENWKEELMIALLEDFLISIYEEKLEVMIGNTVLNSESLDGILERLYTVHRKRLNKTYNYYKVLTSDKTRVCQHNLEDLGQIEFKFLLGVDTIGEDIDFHRQALVVRKSGMKLFDRGYISGNIPFAAILTLTDDKVNEFFRKLEPPRHDAWEVDLYEGKKSKKYVREKIQEVFRFMKDTIIEYGSIPVADEMDVVGLGAYLPDDFFDFEYNKDKSESISDKSKSITIIETKKEKKKERLPSRNIDDDISVKGVFGEGDFMGGSKGDTDKKRKSSSKEQGRMKESDEGVEISYLSRIQPLRERLIPINPKAGKYKVILGFKEPISLGLIDVFLNTEDGDEKAKIESVTSSYGYNFKTQNNRLYFKLEEEKMDLNIELELEYKGTCSMGVKIYGGKL